MMAGSSTCLQSPGERVSGGKMSINKKLSIKIVPIYSTAWSGH